MDVESNIYCWFTATKLQPRTLCHINTMQVHSNMQLLLRHLAGKHFKLEPEAAQ
jgi:hypothetical protein